MAIKRRGSAGGDDTALDLTPMLDVVFIMLIFFIVTATFVKESGVEVTRPEALTAVQQDRVSITVAVTADEKIWINREETSPNEVRPTVEKLQAENPQGTVVIQADQGAPAGLVLEVSRQIQSAGVSMVGIASEKD